MAAGVLKRFAIPLLAITAVAAAAALITGAAPFHQNPVRPVQEKEKNNQMETEISYGKEDTTFHRQKLSLSKHPYDVNASDLRPLVTRFDSRFVYRYHFTRRTQLQEVPLLFLYRDGSGGGPPGTGWQVVYRFSFKEENPEVNILAPFMVPYKGEEGWFFLVEDEEIPLRLVHEGEQDILVTKKSYNGATYRFTRLDCGEDTTALPYGVDRENQSPTRFFYDHVNGVPRLHRIRAGEFSLLFQFRDEQGKEQLDKILLQENGTVEDQVTAKWDLDYTSVNSPGTGMIFLTRITAFINGQEPQELKFSYGTLEPVSRGLAQKEEGKSSAWRLDENNTRWILPGHMSIRNYPGLRFMDLDRDGQMDLVDTEFRQLKSWIGDKAAPGYWKDYSRKYVPAHPSVRYRGPKQLTGSQYSGLVKLFRIYQYHTKKFQSIITSYYTPSADGKRLEYYSYVDFPRVLNGALNPDAGGNCWQRDEDDLLKLPVPLQYEGGPWPGDRPGIAAVERANNQGAQFVDFTMDNKINLLYIGLRYRDAETGEVLLAGEGEAGWRDTKNCVQWYETVWSHLGKTRRVKVDVCQGSWKAYKKYWSEWYPEEYPGKTFWQRQDLDKQGCPNGRFVLPWHKDPNYHFHYVGLRNVQFARLDKRNPQNVFAVVQGRACPNRHPPVPEAKDIYLLERGKWEWKKLPRDSGFYPPEDFFENYDGIFADINGDGIDDALLAKGSRRKTYINTGDSNPGKRWEDAPAFYLPRECDLGNGSCQLINLTGSKAVELFVGTGHRVYINLAHTITNTANYPTYMTSFTDEKGKEKSVEEIQ